MLQASELDELSVADVDWQDVEVELAVEDDRRCFFFFLFSFEPFLLFFFFADLPRDLPRFGTSRSSSVAWNKCSTTSSLSSSSESSIHTKYCHTSLAQKHQSMNLHAQISHEKDWRPFIIQQQNKLIQRTIKHRLTYKGHAALCKFLESYILIDIGDIWKCPNDCNQVSLSGMSGCLRIWRSRASLSEIAHLLSTICLATDSDPYFATICS